MPNRKEIAMIHKIIGSIGFVLFLLGAGGMDSSTMVVPGIMVLTGMGMLFWSAWEAGIYNEQKNRR